MPSMTIGVGAAVIIISTCGYPRGQRCGQLSVHPSSVTCPAYPAKQCDLTGCAKDVVRCFEENWNEHFKRLRASAFQLALIILPATPFRADKEYEELTNELLQKAHGRAKGQWGNYKGAGEVARWLENSLYRAYLELYSDHLDLQDPADYLHPAEMHYREVLCAYQSGKRFVEIGRIQGVSEQGARLRFQEAAILLCERLLAASLANGLNPKPLLGRLDQWHRWLRTGELPEFGRYSLVNDIVLRVYSPQAFARLRAHSVLGEQQERLFNPWFDEWTASGKIPADLSPKHAEVLWKITEDALGTRKPKKGTSP